jgi:hypothetical protein
MATCIPHLSKTNDLIDSKADHQPLKTRSQATATQRPFRRNHPAPPQAVLLKTLRADRDYTRDDSRKMRGCTPSTCSVTSQQLLDDIPVHPNDALENTHS